LLFAIILQYNDIMVYKSKIPLLIRIDPDVKERLAALAQKEERSINKMAEMLLRNALKEHTEDMDPKNIPKGGK